MNIWVSKPNFSSFPILTISFSLVYGEKQQNLISPKKGKLEVWLDNKRTNSYFFGLDQMLKPDTKADENLKKERADETIDKDKDQSLLILLDISGSVGAKNFQKGKFITLRIVNYFHDKIPIGLGTFGDYVFIPDRFAETPDSVKTRLGGVIFLSEKKTLLNRALFKAINLESPPKQILVITDGKEIGSQVDLESIIEIAQRKKIIINALALTENLPLKKLGHACLATGGKIFPKDSNAGELIIYLSPNFLNKKTNFLTTEPKKLRKPQVNIKELFSSLNTDDKKIFALNNNIKHDIHVDISQSKNYPWKKQKILLRFESDDYRWEKEIYFSAPLKVLIPYIISEHPIISILIIVFAFIILLVIILIMVFKQKKVKIKLSKEEVSRLKELVHKETMEKIEARKKDSETYQKLYHDTIPHNGISKKIEKEPTPGISVNLQKGEQEDSPTGTEKRLDRFEDNYQNNVISTNPKACLIPQNGKYKGRVFPLYFHEVKIGRHSESTISLTDPYISDFHCKIKNVDGKYLLFDTLSKNGTYLNSKKLIRPRMLENWDEILIGETSISFRITENN